MPQLPTGNVLKWKLNCDRFATAGAGKSFFGRDSELKVNRLLANSCRFWIESSTGERIRLKGAILRAPKLMRSCAAIFTQLTRRCDLAMREDYLPDECGI